MPDRAEIAEGGTRPVVAGLWAALHVAVSLVLLGIMAGRAIGAEHVRAADAFADHCFSPFLTMETVEERIAAPGIRVDFYDLRPFRASNPVSPAALRPATPGTDRRCEVAFDGAHVATGVEGVLRGLSAEGIDAEAEVPQSFPAQPGAEFVAARFLNPNRIAVVQVGTRPGPDGIETFINVERLAPLDE